MLDYPSAGRGALAAGRVTVTIAVRAGRAPKTGRARALKREQKLLAFDPGYRDAISVLATHAPEIEDLAETFPALLFALATGYGTPETRAAALESILSGRSLLAASAALGLPWWLRRLPGAAFRRPFKPLPADDTFAVRIANAIPSSPAHVAPWLERVTYAYEAVDRDFALWMASAFRGAAPVPGHEALAWMTAWAWHSRHTDTSGYRLIRRPWSALIGARRALEEVTCWQNRIGMIGPVERTMPDLWCPEGEAMGLRFVPLVTVEDFIAEAEAMDNCLDQFGLHLESGTRRIYSVRKGAKRIADVDLGPHPTDTRIPQIVQLRGPRNRRADSAVWQAAYAWLAGSAANPPSLEDIARRRRHAHQALRRFWAPHLQDTAGTEHNLCLEQLLLGGGATRPAASRTATTARREPLADSDRRLEPGRHGAV